MSKASDISGSGENSNPDGDKYQIQSDADCLQRHAEITSDPKRHSSAHAELQKRVADSRHAVHSSKKSMTSKVKAGLAKAFSPENGQEKNPTPTKKAGGAQALAKTLPESEGALTNG
jgi:hypothetical protein